MSELFENRKTGPAQATAAAAYFFTRHSRA
jgi:hypothetical protein